MPDVFGIEGGGAAPKNGPQSGSQSGSLNQGAANKPKSDQPEGLLRGEGPEGRYFQYDNEVGAMIFQLPAHLAEHRAELQEDLMDAFYGEAAGGKDMHASIDAWIADWIERKQSESEPR